MKNDLKLLVKRGFEDNDGNMVIAAKYAMVSHFSHGLAPVQEKKDGKWGYIDTEERYVIEPHFDSASSFNERCGLASVSLGGKDGVIDTKGNWLLEPRFEKIWGVEGCYDMLLAEQNGLRGYIDFQGKWVIQPRWNWTECNPATGLILVQDPKTDLYGYIDLGDNIVLEPQLSNEPEWGGYGCIKAVVRDGDDDKYGFMDDKSCHWIIEPRFDNLGRFIARHGVAPARMDGLWGVIDRQGNWLCKPRFDEVGSFDNSFCLAMAKDGHRYGFINPKGEWIIEPKFQYAEDFEDRSGFAVVEVHNRFGFINSRGEYTIAPTMIDRPCKFETKTGLSHVYSDGPWYYIDTHGNRVDIEVDWSDKINRWPTPKAKCGLMDKDGKVVIEPKFDMVYGFDDENRIGARVKQSYGVLDKEGNWLIPPVYDSSHILPYEKDELSVVSRNGRYGFMDYYGKEVIECQYEYAHEFDKELQLAPVKYLGKWGAMDRSGQWKVPPVHDRLSMEYGHIRVSDDGLVGMVDCNGNTVIPCQFDSMNYYNADLDRWVVVKDFLYGFCNSKCEIVIPIEFDDVQPFHSKHSVVAVRKGGLWGLMDADGRWLWEPMFDWVDSWFDPDMGPIPVGIDDKYGYVDIYSDEPLKLPFQDLSGFDRRDDGTAECVLLDGREVLIDKKCNIIKYLTEDDNTRTDETLHD